jgi:hypothetical protein
MAHTIQTTERTFNKRVKQLIKSLLPTAHQYQKKHVAGIGYATYLFNAAGETIGHVFRENGGMKINIK